MTTKPCYQETTGEHYVDFDWNEFSENLFKQPPCDPFTFRMEFLDDLKQPQVFQLLGQTLMTGARQLYNKQLADITEQELDRIREYFKSLGLDVEANLTQSIQYLPELKKTMPVNHYTYHFKPCRPELNLHNRPEKIIS